jgi:hypothetical protein
LKLANGQLLPTANSAFGNQSQLTPNNNPRALTPKQYGLNNNIIGQTPSSQGRYQNRSLSPIGSEIPGEKKFIEVNTKEQLIISSIGIYASKKGEDKYMPLEKPE